MDSSKNNRILISKMGQMRRFLLFVWKSFISAHGSCYWCCCALMKLCPPLPQSQVCPPSGRADCPSECSVKPVPIGIQVRPEWNPWPGINWFGAESPSCVVPRKVFALVASRPGLPWSWLFGADPELNLEMRNALSISNFKPVAWMRLYSCWMKCSMSLMDSFSFDVSCCAIVSVEVFC